MFTVKFIKNINEDSSNTVSISCPHYQAYIANGHTTVTTYKDHFDTAGVERHVGEKLVINNGAESIDVGFDVCFVENEAGKTIDTIRSTKND